MKRKRRIGIAVSLLGYLLLAGIVPLTLLAVSSFDISRRIIIEQAGEFHHQRMTDLSAYLTLYADQIEDLAADVAGNEALSEALDEHTLPAGTDTFSVLKTQAQIGYILNSYVGIKGLVSIDLFSPEGRHFHVGDTLDARDLDQARVPEMLREARRSATSIHWRGIEDNLNRASTQKKVLMATRVVRHFRPETGTTEVVGLLVINIDTRVIMNEFLAAVKTPDRLTLMLLDQKGLFVYHSDSGMLGLPAATGFADVLRADAPVRELRLDEEDVILAAVPVARTGLQLAGALPRSVLVAPTNALIYAGVVLLLIGIAAIGLIAWRFTRRVVAPVRDVSEGFGRLKDHPDDIPAPLALADTEDEISDMVTGFNRHLEVLAAQRVVAHELYEAQQAAESANLAKSRFLATMSHELRTPMNAVLGMAQLLQLPELTEAERKEYAGTILSSGQSLLSLLNDILDLSKIEAGRMALESGEFEPALLLDEVETLFSRTANAKSIKLNAEWNGRTGRRYLGDAYRVRQMLVNLIGNAIKFTAKGSVRIEAGEVVTDGTKAVLEFAVIDTGIGIPDASKEMVFEAFSQADDSVTRKYGGSGLGLSIVRRLARLMGGDVGVDSRSGVGSRFWFRIQVQRVDECDEVGVATRSVMDVGGVGSLSGHVLVVEDQPSNQKVIKALLGQLGVSVTVLDDGQQAVAALEGGMAVDLVLMDIQMPVMNGDDATARIRQWETQGRRPRLPVIALTANAYEGDRQRALAAGMDDFLAKPVSISLLRTSLARWLPARPPEPAATASSMLAPDAPRAPLAAQAPECDPRIETILARLFPLLAERKFDALAVFRDLQAAVVGTPQAAGVAEAGKSLSVFQFADAMQQLRETFAVTDTPDDPCSR
ncbi:hybrid sensor histidine kinase/response regulator [Denitromonas halophila]|uniref:Virulence sensor protein BvgS n=1 Tax=Denitromonas halophila TaxID=1629404 RepID=A0A557QJW8_9RHOO|nr:hybrid sensor histidine kinase/response regulator [Denitromonas halophila]TVO53201.1 response regulator [Denitromonas halophila]